MEKYWSVSVNVGAKNILNIGDDYLSGVNNVNDYADTIKGCAEHLLAFAGREPETVTELRGEVARLTALCYEYRGERDECRAELSQLKDVVYGEHGLDERLKAADAGWSEWQTKAGKLKDLLQDANTRLHCYSQDNARLTSERDDAVSALTRARADGMEDAAKIAERATTHFKVQDRTVRDIAAAIRAAAKGENG